MAGVGENFGVNKDNMDLLKQQLEKAIREVPNFDKLKDHIEMTITNEGLRIELMESAKGTFYDIGSPNLNTDGRDLVVVVAQELGKLPNRLAIEGHTDAKFYSKGRNYSNWELSADRANAARRLMQMHGVGENQMTQARGFADQRLRRNATPMDPSNRRISVIVQYLVKPGTEDKTVARAGDVAPAAANPTDAKTPGRESRR
jgi:chemotaxis protein MotB